MGGDEQRAAEKAEKPGKPTVRKSAETPAAKQPAARKPAENRAPSPPKIVTPWGAAAVVEELVLNQTAGDRKFASLVQLLETPRGERLVRFAYSTGGTARRGPVTLRKRDLDRLRTALADRPGLADALGVARERNGAA